MTWVGITKPQLMKLLCAMFWIALFVGLVPVVDAIKVVAKDIEAVKDKWRKP